MTDPTPTPPPDFLAALDLESAAALLGAEATTEVADEALLPELQPGTQLGRYRIEGPPGRGGAGVVYRAYDPELDRPVALKVLPPRRRVGADRPSPSGDPVLDEARAASALDHPHVGTVYEVGEVEEGIRYIAMAWYGGGTLRDRLARGPIPAPEALEIASQLSEGLGAAHAAGLVHRDVKPENVVFDAEGRAKIVDFGLAVPGRSNGGWSGTPAYMSPERRLGVRADSRSDVWAVGVVLHEMLVGARPGSAGPDASGPLASVIARCLAADPDERPSTGTALARMLREAAEGRRRRRRVRWLAFAGGALVLAGASAGVVLSRGLPRVVAASGSASGTFPERGWVLVADFDVSEGLEEIGLATREALAVDLQQSAFVKVVSRAQIAEVLARMEVPPSAPLDLPLAMEVAERFGAGAVVGTTVTQVGSHYVLSAHALDPTTGAELLAVRATASTSRVLGAVERLSREVRARLGEDPTALARSLPLPDVTTRSLEALRLYAEAERALARNDPAARALTRAAIEVDPDFAMAHRLAAAEASGRLRFDEVMAHISRAYQLRDRLPERERGHVEGIYLSNVLFEPVAAAEAYEVLLRRYPDDARAWHNLGVTLQSWLGDPEGAFGAFERAAAADSSLLSAFTNGASAAYMVGRPGVADQLAAAAEGGGIAGFETRWRVARAFAEGDQDAVVRGCGILLEERPSAAPGADDYEICGSMDVAAGRLDSGVARLIRARDEAVAMGRYRNAVQAAQGLAVAELFRNDPVAAAAHIGWVPARVPAEDFGEPDRFIARVNLVVQAELLGFSDLARTIQRAYPPHPDPGHWFARTGGALIDAAGAVRRGEGARALATLEDGLTPGHHAIGWHVWEEVIRGLAQSFDGDLDAASRHLQSATDPGFLTSPFATKDRIHLPLILIELLRIESERGDDVAVDAVRERLARLGGWGDTGRGWFGESGS